MDCSLYSMLFRLRRRRTPFTARIPPTTTPTTGREQMATAATGTAPTTIVVRRAASLTLARGEHPGHVEPQAFILLPLWSRWHGATVSARVQSNSWPQRHVMWLQPSFFSIGVRHCGHILRCARWAALLMRNASRRCPHQVTGGGSAPSRPSCSIRFLSSSRASGQCLATSLSSIF